jgi:HK97 gp10 family phage protein
MVEVFKGEGPLETTISIEGLKEIQKEMDRIVEDMSGDPVKAAMAKATLIVMRDARRNAPVDRGILRASIVPQVVTRTNEVQGIVGSNVKWAPYQEFGTRPFTPPRAPIWQWALRVAKGNKNRASSIFARAMVSISRRGIIAKQYLQRAFDDNLERITRIVSDAIGRVVKGN